MKKITLKGRPTYKGVAEGFAIVFHDSVSGNTGGIGDTDGIIYEKSNTHRGLSIQNKVLVLPCAKGSNGFSAHFKSAKLSGVCPAAWVVTKMDSRTGVAIATLEIPAVSDFEGDDPLDIIETGDWVNVNGDTGIIEITKK